MPVTASSIIKRAADIIQDKTNVRWPAPELVRWLNDGQREVALHRPDAFTKHEALDLVAGTRQSLPVGAVKLIDIPNNADGDLMAIRQVPRRALDEQMPGWHGMDQADSIRHFCYDPRDPRSFYVYPPAAAGVAVNAVFAVYPEDVAEPADGSTHEDVVGEIAVPDIFANALLDFILYRAYLKDSDYAGNGARAQAHYGAFAGALGIEAKATVGVGPTVGRNGEPAVA